MRAGTFGRKLLKDYEQLVAAFGPSAELAGVFVILIIFPFSECAATAYCIELSGPTSYTYVLYYTRVQDVRPSRPVAVSAPF